MSSTKYHIHHKLAKELGINIKLYEDSEIFDGKIIVCEPTETGKCKYTIIGRSKKESGKIIVVYRFHT